MLWRTILLLIALALPLDAAWAGIASSWRVGFGGGANAGSSVGLLASWNRSLGGFVEASHEVKPMLEVAPRLTAGVAWYERYRGEGWYSIPEVSWSADPVDVLRTIEARVAVRARPPGSVRPFMGLVGGMLVADVPRVRWTGTDMSDPSRQWTFTAPRTDEIVTRALVGVNAGVLFRSTAGSVDAGFEGTFMVSTDNRLRRFEMVYFLGFR